MSIVFKQTIIHILDLSHDMPILSASPITLTDDTEAYITSYLADLFDNHSVCKAVFEDTSMWYELLQNGLQDFYAFSCDLAHQFYAYMQTFETISSGDLIITHFERDTTPYLAFYKLNYKEAYTHTVDQDIHGPINQLIKHKTIFHDTVSKIQEAAIINLETFNLLLLDIHKEKYVHTLLGCTAPLSTKQKIKVVEKVITEAIEENFENKVEALSFAKSNLAKSIESTSSIMLDDVLHDTFGDHEELITSCMNSFEEKGITDPVIELPQAEKVSRKYTSHKIKTNTGIELKLPTQLLNDPDTIEFINNPDGTLSILLKNIGSVINK